MSPGSDMGGGGDFLRVRGQKPARIDDLTKFGNHFIAALRGGVARRSRAQC